MKRAYVEITNRCNRHCSFCPGHTRAGRQMTPAEFSRILARLEGRVETVFLHVMGEPLFHPDLAELLKIADASPLTFKITTNGTLLASALPALLACRTLTAVHISVHSFEGEVGTPAFDRYLDDCLTAADALAAAGKFAVLRLWNRTDAAEASAPNDAILARFRAHFDREPWVETHRGVRMATHIFLEWGDRFVWPEPEMASETVRGDEDGFCYGLITQIGVLADGTVVPCCLDRNGSVALGNLFETPLEEILQTPRARAMRQALEHHRITEDLCRGCRFRERNEHAGL